MKLAATILCIILFGCGSGNSAKTADKAYPSYIDQILQGKIADQDWAFVQGRVTQPAEGFADQINWSFSLLSDERANICSGFVLKSVDGLQVIFSGEPIVGKRELGDPHTVTLHDEAAGENVHFIALDGFIELTEVSTATVSGKIVAHYDDSSTVNGNFTVTRCCRDASGFDYEQCSE